jgi:hypothetical protein
MAVRGISKMKTKKKKGESKQALQNIVNRYCRLRDCFGDTGAACISCNKWVPFAKGDGGHFIAAKHNITRFDERNVNFQCQFCNRFQHGNLANYYVGMVSKYGQEVVDELMALQGTHKKWTPEEIKALRKHYNGKLKAIARGEDPRTENNSGLAMSDMFSDIS